MTDQSLIRPELLTLSIEGLRGIAPHLVAFGGALVGLLLASVRRFSAKWLVFLVTSASCFGAAFWSWTLMGNAPATVFNQMLALDAFGNFFNIIFLLACAITLIASLRYLDRDGLQLPEYYVLLLFSTIGMMLMASALDLVVIFIALEIMSLSVYVLVGFRRADRKSNEAAMKYFILGAAASAILLYGAALLYGATGSMNIREILATLRATPALAERPLFILGSWLVVTGFLFKIASVPFHMWMPDVYEGAPTPVTGFMTTGIKVASFATLLRILDGLGYAEGISERIQAQMHTILWVCAALTMLVGNVVALTQVNLKRMLGYSSIAHTGYLLIGLMILPQAEQAGASVIFYLATYAVMNIGAFILLTLLSESNDRGINLHDLAGLSQRRPWMALCMAVFMFSMAGIPPTAGFVAKYRLFYSAIQAGEVVLTVLAVLCSAISVYYYLRVMVVMYMQDPATTDSPRSDRSESKLAAVATFVMVVLTLQVGILPNALMDAARRAIQSLS